MTTFADLEQRLAAIEAELASCPLTAGPAATAADLIAIGEAVLEAWTVARGEAPTREEREGFRLLALHRQGARREPTFNACRETARELAYHYNLVTGEPEHADTPKRLRLMLLVVRHLLLFVAGKMEVAGLGEFCCAAKPMRAEGR